MNHLGAHSSCANIKINADNFSEAGFRVAGGGPSAQVYLGIPDRDIKKQTKSNQSKENA